MVADANKISDDRKTLTIGTRLAYPGAGVKYDVVITNDRSTSNEEYVVKMAKFADTYTADENSSEKRYIPTYDSRLLTQVDENVMITTAWGSLALCLAGSYIVTYDASSNDYNTIEKGAFESTYTREEQKKYTK